MSELYTSVHTNNGIIKVKLSDINGQKLVDAIYDLEQQYDLLHFRYCNLADFLAFKLGKKNTDDAMEEFGQWLINSARA